MTYHNQQIRHRRSSIDIVVVVFVVAMTARDV